MHPHVSRPLRPYKPASESERTQTYFFPFRNQVPVCVLFLQAKFVQFLGNRFPLIVQVVDVSTALVCDLKNGPNGFAFPFPFVAFVLSCVPVSTDRSPVSFVFDIVLQLTLQRSERCISACLSDIGKPLHPGGIPPSCCHAPSLSFCSSSFRVGSMSSHPSGNFVLDVLTFPTEERTFKA